MGEDFTQAGAGEDLPEVVIQRILPGLEIVPGAGLLGVLLFVHLARAGGIEPPLPGWKPAIRPRKPVCCRYTKPAVLSGSGRRESNPRLRTGGTPNQDLKSCVLPLHYTRQILFRPQIYTKIVKRKRNLQENLHSFHTLPIIPL